MNAPAIKLYQYPAGLGLSCPSPFCVKAEILMKMAGVAFEDIRISDPRKGPKGKLPAIEVDGEMIGDSEMIRYQLESRTGHDFDAGLSETDKAVSHAMARMIEERLYWAIVHSRWADDVAFATVKKEFFGSMPPVVRNILPVVARRQVKGYLHGQGTGRHSRDEILNFVARDLKALSDWLGDKPFMMGDNPTYLDSTAFAHVQNIVVPAELGALRKLAEKHQNLIDYVSRCEALWFPQ